jgi:hypothetical protein
MSEIARSLQIRATMRAILSLRLKNDCARDNAI